MKSFGIREAKARLSALARAAANGESTLLTDYGRPLAVNGQTFLPGQANNFYIFPAIGMAIYATQAKRVTDEMFIEAAAVEHP
ncbi:MAG TPA: malic enzyme-like NAD(P)-binding protein [Roseiarcus sp.]|nr:malic enzyme-like NAD(P)-binding protein [Roseiarcus sp.]